MKKRIIPIVTCLLVVLSLTACNTPAPVVNTTTPQVRTLSSSGTGEVYVVPDIAYINVGVSVNADEVSAALDENNIQANAVAQAVKDMGVESKDIQTSSFNVYPMQDYDMNGQVSRRYYVVDNTIYITVRDLSKLGLLLDAVVQAGANTINSISFDLEDKDAAQAEARDQAIKNAMEEAKAVAATSEVTLGELQSVNVYTYDYTTTSYSAKGGGGMMESAASVPVAAGQLVITASANLVYEIK